MLTPFATHARAMPPWRNAGSSDTTQSAEATSDATVTSAVAVAAVAAVAVAVALAVVLAVAVAVSVSGDTATTTACARVWPATSARASGSRFEATVTRRCGEVRSR
jgi:hypothetical protein